MQPSPVSILVQRDSSESSRNMPSLPQLATLDLPSPGFGRSFADMVIDSVGEAKLLPSNSFLPSPTFKKGHRSAASTSSYFSPSARSSYHAGVARDFSATPLSASFGESHDADNRERTWKWSEFVRFQMEQLKAHRSTYWNEPDQEVWSSSFPQAEWALDFDISQKISSEDHTKLASFLSAKGYAIDAEPLVPAASLPTNNLAATRCSDSLPVYVRAVALDSASGSSDELDIVEHLSILGTQTNAFSRGAIPIVPVVAILPYNESTTLVVFEHWAKFLDYQDTLEDIDVCKHFVRDLVAALSFLHSQRISHLAITPSSIFYSADIVPPSSIMNISSLKNAKPRKHFTFGGFDKAAKLSATSKTVKPMVRINTEERDVNPKELKHYQSASTRFGADHTWVAPPELTGDFVSTPPTNAIKGVRLDPYAIDVYCLGRVYSKLCPGLPLEWTSVFDQMVTHEPAQRPTAADVHAILKKLL